MQEKLKIYAVEDDRTSLEVYKELSNKLGYEFIGSSKNSAETLSDLEKLNPDIILMDIVIEGTVDGIDLSKVIHVKYDIPIIFISAFDDSEKLDRIKISNAYGYLLKPFKEKELYLAIEMAFKKYQLVRKLRHSRKQLKTTLKCMGEGLIATDKENKISYVNPKCEEILGQKSENLKGLEIDEVMQLQESSLQKNIRLSSLPENNYEDYDLKIDKDKHIPIKLNIAKMKYNGSKKKGLVILFQDISERKKNFDEKEKLIKRLRKVISELNSAYLKLDKTQDELVEMEQKNLALAMAVTANHEINQPLMVIRGNIELLKIEYEKKFPEKNKYFKRIDAAIIRIEEILKKLREIDMPIITKYLDETMMISIDDENDEFEF